MNVCLYVNIPGDLYKLLLDNLGRENNQLTIKEKKKSVIYGSCIYLMKIIKKEFQDFEEDFTFFSSWKQAVR
jgi:predicted lactoylglutathione lyase